MRLLVVIVMFVMVSLVFAEDARREEMPGGRVPTSPQGQEEAQNNEHQSNPQSQSPLVAHQDLTQQQPANDCEECGKAYADKDEERLCLLREANCLQRGIISGGKTTSWWQRAQTFAQASIALLALVVAVGSLWTARRSLRIANRAY